ncbi:MAG: signal recognition particle-docking protein FtsY [Myxococcales bacterium]|nr:signal recognition particle-docking protein FtsY [Myxococcales bacterium]
MQGTQPAQAAVDSISGLDRLVEYLGFHDAASMILSLVFVVIALAFVVSGIVFLFRKHKERKNELHKIVTEVQASKKEEIISAPKKLVESEALHAKKTVVTKAPDEKPREPIVVVEKEKSPKHESTQTKASLVTEEVKIKARPELITVKESEPEIKAEVEAEQKEIKEQIAEKLKIEPTKEVKEFVSEAPKKALNAALKNTRGGFMSKLARLFSSAHEISDDDFEAMETILFTADIGVKTAQKLLDNVRERVEQEKNSAPSFLRSALKEEMRTIFATAPATEASVKETPKVIMFVGVNGAGKTTSIGKLGAQLKNQGKSVYFGAGDTYRAAAVKQLNVWGERTGVQVVSGKENSDSASVLFDTISQAKKAHADVVLCDTAGRLHTKSELMDELKKVHRVVNKAHEGAPHEVFLVVDATMGQNAIMQAREFAQATPLTGIILSKLDGTAKGGVALGIVDELKIPIRYVGIGEQVDDLREFNADQFVEALFEENNVSE